MRILFIVFLIFSMTVSAIAGEFFTDKELSEIQVVEVGDGIAYLQNLDGVEEEVFLGDKIGIEFQEIIEIGEAYITVKGDRTRTRIPVAYGIVGNPAD